MTADFKLRKLSKDDDIPFDLLLIADETVDAIKKYIYDSDIYQLYVSDNPVAIIALYRIDNLKIEIKNIAVIESFQGKGIGSYLIRRIKEIAANDNYKEVIVGTPDAGIREILFYEKNGFTIFDVKENFFIENYSIPIIENGVTLKDMTMLKVEV